jgi:hypothetical protein
MIYPKSKEEITAVVLEQLKDDPDNPWKDKTVDSVMFDWWTTGRTGNGLRLNHSGSVALEMVKISYYDYPFSPPNTVLSKDDWQKYLRLINKKVHCPFYLGVNTSPNKKATYIRVYDSKIAMMIALYGNLQDYIGSVR